MRRGLPASAVSAPIGGNVKRYLDASERREVLRHYGRSYGLDVFIETGTNTGDTPWALRFEFNQIYTIELDDKLYREAVNRLSPATNIEVLYGDSAEVLPYVLTRIDRPALVWLDGHHSGPGTARGALDTPVCQELEALFKDGRPHVILVDDARIFDGQPEHWDEPHYKDYPTLEWIHELANANDYDYMLKDDIVRLTPTEK